MDRVRLRVRVLVGIFQQIVDDPAQGQWIRAHYEAVFGRRLDATPRMRYAKPRHGFVQKGSKLDAFSADRRDGARTSRTFL